MKLDRQTRPVRPGKQPTAGGAGQSHHGDAGVADAVHRQSRQGRFLGGFFADRHIHQQERFGAPFLGGESLGSHVGKSALDFGVVEGFTRRHEPSRQNDFALDVEAGVVVEAMFLGDNAITHRHHFSFDRTLAGITGGPEVLCGDRFAVEAQCGRGIHIHGGHHLEGLAEAVAAGRGQANLGVTLDQPIGRGLQALGADASAFAGIVGKPGHVVCETICGTWLPLGRRVHPTGEEKVGVALFGIVAVGGEDQVLAVRREHREAVEFGGVGDALEVGAVDVDCPEIELTPRGLGSWSKK